MEAKAEIKEAVLSRTTSGLRFTQSQGEDKVGLDALRANQGEMWPETPAPTYISKQPCKPCLLYV